jgi:hypothetical protein
MMYPATAEYFGDTARTLRAIGANLIGGCCGTTADHIAAMRAALDDETTPLPEIQVFEPSRRPPSWFRSGLPRWPASWPRVSSWSRWR